MSLKVRQLLAYLDDTLDAVQARQIGQRLAEDADAQALLEHIRRLLNERQLPPTEASLDANELAAYLDGSLDAERDAEIETVLRTSEEALAEAAACHQILSSYKAQPSAVPMAARQRMYGLPRQKAAGSERPRRHRPSPPEPEEALVEDYQPPLEVPEYLLADRRQRRLRTAAILVGLLVLLGVTLWKIWPRGSTVTRPGSTQLAEISPTSPKPPPSAPQNGKQEAKTSQLEPSVKPAEPPVKPAEPPVKPAEPPVKPAEPPVKPAEPPMRLGPNPARREGIGKQIVQPGNSPTVILRRESGQDTWQRVPLQGPVATHEQLLVLPGLRADLRLESGVNLTLAGNLPEFSAEFPVLESSVVLHVPEQGFDADLTLRRGRIFLSHAKAQGEVTVRCRFLDEIWDLILKTPQSTAALELWGIHPPDVPFDKEGKGEGPMFFCNLFGLEGQADLKVRYRHEALPAQSIFTWNNRQGAPRGPQPFGLPRWYADNKLPQTAQVFVLALTELNTRLANKPPEVAIAETRKESRAPSRIVAIRALGALDAIQELMTILGSSKDTLERDFAMFTLRQWIGQHPDHELQLYRTLIEKMQAVYTPQQAEVVLELLHTFPPDARNNPVTYEKLIANLGDKNQAIRHLSHWHLMGLDPGGRGIQYDPAGDAVQLANGQKEWKKRIPDGKLPPASGAKSADDK